MQHDITPETISAISDLLDADIAMENIEVASKVVYKSALSSRADEKAQKYYRTMPTILIGREVREGMHDGEQS